MSMVEYKFRNKYYIDLFGESDYLRAVSPNVFE